MLSLVTIIAIYREGGILKRLSATPLRPHTILTAHVLVETAVHAVTLAVMVLAGRRYFPIPAAVPIVSFTVALLFTTVSLLSLGFLIASVVPTARFAQPIGTLILYPMLGLSGLFVPIESLPPLLQRGGASAAAHLRGVAAERHLARRGVVRTPRRRRGPGRDLSGADGRIVARVSLGIARQRLGTSRRILPLAPSVST